MASDSTEITVTPNVPVALEDPANLAYAANFAWNEFIALTWPAMAQGPTNFPRGEAQADGTYGARGTTGQVVWETYRHRIEVFPGEQEPNGYSATAPNYGYAAKPVYRYRENEFIGIPAGGLIPPYKAGVNPDIPPFHNLDEVTQITLNAMYAGVVDPIDAGGSQHTSIKEKILFEAKVNEPIYSYAVEPRTLNEQPYQLFDTTNPISGQIRFNSGEFVQTGDATTYPPPYVELPPSNPAKGEVGSIELKAAWRRLNPATEDTSKFYTAPVRYYVGAEENGLAKIEGFIDSNDPKVNEVWGLVALHIIHKLPNAQAFVYATFSQNDNILDTHGNPVEEPNGTTKPQYLNQNPFTPELTIIPNTPPGPTGPTDTNPKAYQQAIKGGGTANTNSPQLYFQNLKGKEVIMNPDGTPYEGPVNINRRIFPIPPTITEANSDAHTKIRNANMAAVWTNYRLVNVQARPLNLDSIPAGEEPTYFLANEVVETNTGLQRFSGSLRDINGRIFDFEAGEEVHNTYVKNPDGKSFTAFNMGGCMGCHGSQGQKVGGDFSVIFARGRISKPDIIQEDEEMTATAVQLKTKEFFPQHVQPKD